MLDGQHRDMVQSALDVFGITPDLDLALMQPDQRLAQLTGRILARLDAVVREVSPDWILAQGDTATVFAARMVAFYNRVSVRARRSRPAIGRPPSPVPRRSASTHRRPRRRCLLRADGQRQADACCARAVARAMSTSPAIRSSTPCET